MEAINIKAFATDNSQIEALKAFMKALKIKFELTNGDEKPYNPEFVTMIKKGEKEFAEGKGIKMSVADFKELCK
jgi:hypothetical protein